MNAKNESTTEFKIDLGDHGRLTGEKLAFVPEEHHIEYDENHIPAVIDGMPVTGTDGGLPRSLLRRLTLYREGYDQVNLDVSGLYEPNVNEKLYSYVPDGGAFGDILRADFSDGAGSYFVEWSIALSGSIRTRIDSNN